MTKVTTILGIFVLFLYFSPLVTADVNIPGLGSGAYDVPSVGGPGDKVEKAPTCETHLRPKITKVTPDPVKPGEKITIKGENFQSKDCLQDVSFGSQGGTRSDGNSFKYIDDATVEAIVPELKPGLSPVNIVTVGGSAQQILLIQAKDGSSTTTETSSPKDAGAAKDKGSSKDRGSAKDESSPKDAGSPKGSGSSKDGSSSK
jgi:hypothetical protein